MNINTLISNTKIDGLPENVVIDVLSNDTSIFTVKCNGDPTTNHILSTMIDDNNIETVYAGDKTIDGDIISFNISRDVYNVITNYPIEIAVKPYRMKTLYPNKVSHYQQNKPNRFDDSHNRNILCTYEISHDTLGIPHDVNISWFKQVLDSTVNLQSNVDCEFIIHD